MSFTLGDVQTGVAARGYAADTNAQQLTLAQGVLRRIYSLRRWPFMELSQSVNQAAGVNFVPWSATVDRVDAVRISAGTEYRDLEYLDQATLRDLWHEDREPGMPRYWSLDRAAANVIVWPTPDKPYTFLLDTIQKPTIPPDAITAVPLLPDAFLDVVIVAVCADLAARQRDSAAISHWTGEYQQRVIELARTWGMHQRQTATEVPRWDGWEEVAR